MERRVVQRGILASDGELAVGGSVRSPAAFAHCYTVLRPVFDHDLAQKAASWPQDSIEEIEANPVDCKKTAKLFVQCLPRNKSVTFRSL